MPAAGLHLWISSKLVRKFVMTMRMRSKASCWTIMALIIADMFSLKVCSKPENCWAKKMRNADLPVNCGSGKRSSADRKLLRRITTSGMIGNDEGFKSRWGFRTVPPSIASEKLKVLFVT